MDGTLSHRPPSHPPARSLPFPGPVLSVTAGRDGNPAASIKHCHSIYRNAVASVSPCTTQLQHNDTALSSTHFLIHVHYRMLLCSTACFFVRLSTQYNTQYTKRMLHYLWNIDICVSYNFYQLFFVSIKFTRYNKTTRNISLFLLYPFC